MSQFDSPAVPVIFNLLVTPLVSSSVNPNDNYGIRIYHYAYRDLLYHIRSIQETLMKAAPPVRLEVRTDEECGFGVRWFIFVHMWNEVESGDPPPGLRDQFEEARRIRQEETSVGIHFNVDVRISWKFSEKIQPGTISGRKTYIEGTNQALRALHALPLQVNDKVSIKVLEILPYQDYLENWGHMLDEPLRRRVKEYIGSMFRDMDIKTRE